MAFIFQLYIIIMKEAENLNRKDGELILKKYINIMRSFIDSKFITMQYNTIVLHKQYLLFDKIMYVTSQVLYIIEQI